MATIAADDEQAIDRGAFRILLQGVLRPSGAELLGRFCHADPGLEKMVPQHLAAEEALAPDAVFAEIAEVIAPVMSIAGEYRQLQSATGAFERVHELLAETPESDASDATTLAPLQHGITFEDVSFGYRAEAPPQLRDVSLFIPAGSRVAIVGPSGAGKSALAGLLLRLYEPWRGRILFDGVDIRSVTRRSLRAQLGLVPQESYLFNTSIVENIRLGRGAAQPSEMEIEQAARAAAVHATIQQLDDGYATVVGERGQVSSAAVAGAAGTGIGHGQRPGGVWCERGDTLATLQLRREESAVRGFQKFLLRGNVVDLAVAVVIGAAFGAVVTALVKDIITPIIGIAGGLPDFSAWVLTIGPSKFFIGDFINALLSFIVIAAVIYFVVVAPVNKLMERMRPETPPTPTRECPLCLSKIPVKARRCAFCTADLTDQVEQAISRMTGTS